MEHPTEQRQAWFVTSPVRTLVGSMLLGVIVAFLVAVNAPFGFHLGIPPGVTRIGSFVLALFVFMGLRSILQGGFIVDTHARQLIRWWGLFVPYRRRMIPFDTIRSVHLSFGLYPNGVPAARERDLLYNLAVEIDGRCLLLRRERSRTRAKEFGEMLASLFQCTLLDHTVVQSSV
jgi:hypothetical protein